MYYQCGSDLESRFINEQENQSSLSGLKWDCIYEDGRGRLKEFLFLFHDEIVKICADCVQGLPSEKPP